MERLKEEEKKTLSLAREKALALSERRRLAAADLEEKVVREIRDLGMEGTVFRVSIKRE
jgi:DNA repair ATPase RecN